MQMFKILTALDGLPIMGMKLVSYLVIIVKFPVKHQ